MAASATSAIAVDEVVDADGHVYENDAEFFEHLEAEDGRLQALRRELVAEGGELARAVVGFTEGGGGAMYAVLAALDADAWERRIAAVFAVILADEIRHGPMQIHAIARLARDERDWDAAVGMVETISRQRLRMRNEMFGEPSATRLGEIEHGEIEPWPCPITV